MIWHNKLSNEFVLSKCYASWNWQHSMILFTDIERILSNVDNTTFGKWIGREDDNCLSFSLSLSLSLSLFLDEDDWNTVIKECSSLASSWEHLSGYLGLSIGTIDTIRESPRFSSAVGYWNEVLKQWIKQNYKTGRYGLPSWRTLLEGVARIDMWLFKKLAAEHPGIYTV